MTISVKAFSFISSYTGAALSLKDLILQMQATGQTQSHANAVVSFFVLLPFSGTSTNNSEGKASLMQVSPVIKGGVVQIESFGFAFARANPIERIQEGIKVVTYGAGVSNAFPINRFQVEAGAFSFGEGAGCAFDAVFGRGWTGITSRADGIVWAFSEAIGKGISVSKSDIWSTAWAFALIRAKSDAPSQTDTVGIVHDPSIVFSVASHSIASETFGVGYAFAALPMNWKAEISTESDAILVTNDVTPMESESGSIARMKGSILPASAIVGDGDGQSKNGGKGTMKVWHLPILTDGALKIRQAYNAEFTDGILSVT